MARTELTHHGEYEHLIVNDEIDPAYEVLRAVYLIRRFGDSDREGVPHALTSLAAIVRANTDAKNREHAESLIAERVGE
jgi:guanylate kinase